MRDTDFERLIELTYVGGGFIPCNQNAEQLMDNCVKGEVVTFKEVGARDLSFHKCYMSLLAYIWGYLPPKFKKAIPKHDFYKFVKHLRGDYKVLYDFKDGSKMIEYESIAFGNMSEKRFHNYIKEQLPFLYENIIGAYFTGEMYDNIIATIEKDYEKFFDKLEK
jgi:hypothetical protein